MDWLADGLTTLPWFGSSKPDHLVTHNTVPKTMQDKPVQVKVNTFIQSAANGWHNTNNKSGERDLS